MQGLSTVEPRTAVILGSGLGHMAESVVGAVIIPYSDIPSYPEPTVEGHAGELILGSLGGEKVVMASGRFHFYEGLQMEIVSLPMRLFRALGVENVIITNSAGSVRKENTPGSLMAVTGHLDCTFRESPDMPSIVNDSRYHRGELLGIARQSALEEDVDLCEGVYSWTLGPSYETPEEIKMIQKLGGDAVGMSTVPEIRAAAELKMNVLTLSCLTNYAAGVVETPIMHEEVIIIAKEVGERFGRLLSTIVEKIGVSE